jgi:TetR/AcrR family fatty acid metabolism transcriptional regulator
MKHKGKTNPPGRIKIIKSFSRLMKEKDFHSITTAEIAGNAKVTEGLIYKYFKDKKDLLYQVLNDHFAEFLEKLLIAIACFN